MVSYFLLDQPLYTISDIATIFTVSEQTVRKWIKDGKLQSFKVGRGVRVTAEALRSYLAETNE